MPSIKHKGVEIHFETLAEAIAAAEAIAGNAVGEHRSSTQSPRSTEGRWNASRFRDYTGRLTSQQTRLLQELVSSPHGRTARDLAPTLGFKSAKAFGPVLAAMSKHARKAGVAFPEVLTSSRISLGNDGDQDTEFKATEAFIKTAVEAGWKSGHSK